MWLRFKALHSLVIKIVSSQCEQRRFWDPPCPSRWWSHDRNTYNPTSVRSDLSPQWPEEGSKLDVILWKTINNSPGMQMTYKVGQNKNLPVFFQARLCCPSYWLHLQCSPRYRTVVSVLQLLPQSLDRGLFLERERGRKHLKRPECVMKSTTFWDSAKGKQNVVGCESADRPCLPTRSLKSLKECLLMTSSFPTKANANSNIVPMCMYCRSCSFRKRTGNYHCTCLKFRINYTLRLWSSTNQTF